MVVFGGDPLSVDGEFLNDLWRLKPYLPDEIPAWQKVQVLNASKEGRPHLFPENCLSEFENLLFKAYEQSGPLLSRLATFLHILCSIFESIADS